MIISDEYSVYVSNGESGRERLLPELRLTHLWVNHSQNFVNPYDPNIHTNSIEGFWSAMRKQVKRNIPLSSLQDWLNFFLFKKIVPKEEQYETMLSLLAECS